MDGWCVDGGRVVAWMDGWRWTDSGMDGWAMAGLVDGRTKGRVEAGRLGRPMGKQVDGRVDGQARTWQPPCGWIDMEETMVAAYFD